MVTESKAFSLEKRKASGLADIKVLFDRLGKYVVKTNISIFNTDTHKSTWSFIE